MIGIFLKLFSLILLLVCLSCTGRQVTELTNKAIKDSPELQDLDKVCTQIPLPSDFRLIQKGGIDDQKISLSYHYDSQKKYLEVWQFLNTYFKENGWKFVKNESDSIMKTIEYSNDKYRVVIQNGGMRNVEYGIYCEKIK